MSFLSEEFQKNDVRVSHPLVTRKLIKKKYPHIHMIIHILSSDQIDTFWSTFLSIEKEQESLPSEIDRDTISGEVLRHRLVDTGMLQYNDTSMIVERMYKLGSIDKVSYDTVQ